MSVFVIRPGVLMPPYFHVEINVVRANELHLALSYYGCLCRSFLPPLTSVGLGRILYVFTFSSVRSTKLTEDNFEKTVQAEIDAGKTFFVRWIASAG